MKRRTSLILILVIIILAIGFYNLYVSLDNTVTVGDSVFVLPEGFQQSNSTSGEIKISDGINNFTIFNYKDDDIKRYINEYNESKSKDNVSVILNNFTVGDILIYKAYSNNNTEVLHYWFIYNHKVFSIYTENGNKNTDRIVSDLVSSLKVS